MQTRNILLHLFAWSLLIICVPQCWAEYPEKPIRLIVNFSPGDTTDAAARHLIGKAQDILGEKVFVTYRPGAGGTLGVSEISRKRPDGYVIGTCNMPAISLIPMLRNVPYDPFEDIVQIAAVVPYEYALLVRGDSEWQSWQDFVAYAQKHPDDVTYGTLGAGTTNHLVTARIGVELGLKWRHVPFQGGVKATAALLGGHVDIINNTMAPVASALESGQIRALLVTSEKRFNVTPDTPTMKELGFTFSQISYMSIIAPAGLDDSVRSEIEAAFEAAANDREVQDALAGLHLRTRFISGSDYEELLRNTTNEWRDLLPSLGISR